MAAYDSEHNRDRAATAALRVAVEHERGELWAPGAGAASWGLPTLAVDETTWPIRATRRFGGPSFASAE
jgi:hypothetical protein